MSAINTQIQQSGNYQLNQSSGLGATRVNSVAAPSRNASGGFSDAVLLDLSPEAQQYLSGLKTAASTTPTTQATSTDDFTLTPDQKQTIAAILNKYKDAPYTQETFDNIQHDLQEAGLSPDQLSAKDRATSFNSTAILIDALNGGHGDLAGSKPVTDEELKTKANNYMQDVIGQWKKVSADYKAKTDATSVAAAGGAGDA